MRLLDRYLLRELLVPLLYCLVAFYVFWMGADYSRELSSLQDLKLPDVVALYAVKSPLLIVTVLPVALLLALLYALSNHARCHEITAIRAAGVSLWRLSLPYFGVGLAASGMLFVLNEYFVPDSDARAEEIKQRHGRGDRPEKGRGEVRDFGFSNARAGRDWMMAAYDIARAEMQKPQVLSVMPDGSRRWLKAARATYGESGWVFHEAMEYRVAAEANASPVPILRTNLLAKPQFTETPEEIRSEIKIAARLANSTLREADLPLTEIFDYLRLHPKLKRSDEWWLFTQLHGRLAAPWKCVVVVLIALPFGAAAGRRNVFVGVASSIFIAFAYLALTRVSLALGAGGHIPPAVAGWLPNLVFGAAGIWLTTRVR